MASVDKDILFFKIFNSILKAEVEKGHLKWKISDVAREADVSRTLVYHYFGKDKENILKEAYRHMAEAIFLINQGERMAIREVVKKAAQKIQEMPYLFVLFFLEKNKDSELGAIIRNAENQLLERLVSNNPGLTKSDALKIYITELGVVAHQGLSNQEIDEIFSTDK